MATTTSENLIVPEVWADTVGPRIVGKSVLAQISDTDDSLVGRPGSTVIVPKWDYIGDADDLTENVPMDTTTMSMKDSQATIKEVGKAVELTDTAELTGIGSPYEQAQQQVATSVARKMDTDLRLAAVDESNGEAPLKLTGTAAPMSWARLTEGMMLLGDEWNPEDMAGILVHSRVHGQLLRDPDFIRADSFGAGAVILRGQIGAIGGVPVIVSDRAAVANDTVDTLLIRKGALKLLYKRRPLVETDRDILKRTNLVTTNAHYAAKRVDDRGVVVIPTSVAAATADPEG